MSKDNDRKHGSSFWNRSLETRLDMIISLLTTNNEKIIAMANELQILTNEVNSSVQTQQLVVNLLGRVIEFITANAGNPAALTNLANVLKTAAEGLAAAAANTENALNPPPA